MFTFLSLRISHCRCVIQLAMPLLCLAGLYKRQEGGGGCCSASETAADVVTAPNRHLYKRSEPFERSTTHTRLCYWLWLRLCLSPSSSPHEAWKRMCLATRNQWGFFLTSSLAENGREYSPMLISHTVKCDLKRALIHGHYRGDEAPSGSRQTTSSWVLIGDSLKTFWWKSDAKKGW